MLVDSHCHLDFPDFDDDRDAVIERARQRGVDTMITISTRVAEYATIRAIAERYPRVFCSVGTHPHNADDEVHITTADLVKLSRDPKTVAIGEAGLDYHYDNASRDNQRTGFLRHIDAARQTGLPLVIHARNADADVAQILRDESGKGAFPAVLHCYSSGPDLAACGLELGLYLSFSGIVTFKRADEIRAIAASVPMDRLLVETDAPYLAPTPHRGSRNEPAHVADTAAVLATVKDVDLETIAAATTDNFYRIFNKVPRI
jgi:TatD DNase family protein